jgi:hypothetical protein
MRNIDRYVRGMEICLANAAKSPFDELRAVWETLGNSYAFLAELEAGQAMPLVSRMPAVSPRFISARARAGLTARRRSSNCGIRSNDDPGPPPRYGLTAIPLRGHDRILLGPITYCSSFALKPTC